MNTEKQNKNIKRKPNKILLTEQEILMGMSDIDGQDDTLRVTGLEDMVKLRSCVVYSMVKVVRLMTPKKASKQLCCDPLHKRRLQTVARSCGAIFPPYN